MKQEFDKKQSELRQIDNLFKESFAKITKHNNALRVKLPEIIQPFAPYNNELREKLAEISQPFTQRNNELREKLAEMSLPLGRINELQSKIIQSFTQRNNGLREKLAEINKPFEQLQEKLAEINKPFEQLQEELAEITPPVNKISNTDKPRLIVVAGPNGAGKTTITKALLKHDWLKNTTYVNPDEIAQEKFGGWNNKKSFIKAANYAEKMRHECIKNKQSLVFETVFSTDEKVNFIKQAMDAGYFVRLFFIATETPVINIERITLRVSKGGHTVPAEKVIQRHYGSINNCTKVISLVDRVYVYDNSFDVDDPNITKATLVFRVVNNRGKQVVKRYKPMLDWTQAIFNNTQ